MLNTPVIQYTAAIIFALAVLHTFFTKYFQHLAHTDSRHAGLWHLLGEVEVVFGFWSAILLLFITFISDQKQAIDSSAIWSTALPQSFRSRLWSVAIFYAYHLFRCLVLLLPNLLP